MATAAISAGASLLSGITGGKGAKKAAQAQAEAYQKGIDEQRRQFDVTNSNFAPYRDAGGQGLSAILDMLGLNGNDKQQASYDSIEGSPAFTSLDHAGTDALLQNASATGGLRGGNTEHSLVDFRSSLLAKVLQDRLGNLGGLVNTGIGAVNSTGQFGANAATNISDILGKQGGANAAIAAAPWATLSGIFSSIGGNAKSGNGIFSGMSGAGW